MQTYLGRNNFKTCIVMPDLNIKLLKTSVFIYKLIFRGIEVICNSFFRQSMGFPRIDSESFGTPRLAGQLWHF